MFKPSPTKEPKAAKNTRAPCKRTRPAGAPSRRTPFCPPPQRGAWRGLAYTYNRRVQESARQPRPSAAKNRLNSHICGMPENDIHARPCCKSPTEAVKCVNASQDEHCESSSGHLCTVVARGKDIAPTATLFEEVDAEAGELKKWSME